MPLPKPGEKQGTYVSRYMGSPEARASFTDPKQRAAVAYSEYAQNYAKRKAKAAPTK